MGMGCFGKRHSNNSSTPAAAGTNTRPLPQQPTTTSTPATRQLQDIARRSNIADSKTTKRTMMNQPAGERPSDESSSSMKPMLQNTEDVDKTTTVAPAVTHEVIKPQVHEIVETKVHRDIHTHEVHRTVQPVYDVEVLPPKHYVPGPPGPNGEETLIQVPENKLPECTGTNQNWHIAQGRGESCSSASLQHNERGLKRTDATAATQQSPTASTTSATSQPPPKSMLDV
ncbi:hypothetical protein QBC35DRAFT_495084 [Podospora australis]|uniref:Uncharacterized protein n=1 Tax=Podospora australis TaxID=1536484 RepID=A0AAN7AJG2_9PEZI|nr:hypothetical protein QBC35DRAFT_495084 [Podospora australis]